MKRAYKLFFTHQKGWGYTLLAGLIRKKENRFQNKQGVDLSGIFRQILRFFLSEAYVLQQGGSVPAPHFQLYKLGSIN
jgi:membrane carboxypeptidase/penicillin-binding protein